MKLIARRYSEGSDQVAEVEVEHVELTSVPEQELIWVDSDDDPAVIAAVEALLGPRQSADEPVDRPSTSLRFFEHGMTLSVLGLTARETGAATAERPVPIVVRFAMLPNAIVSAHQGPVRGLDGPIAALAGSPRVGRMDEGAFLGAMLDGILDGYFEAIEELERAVEELDEQALRASRQEDLLPALVELRRHIATLRRALAPQRPVFAALVRPPFEEADWDGRSWAGVSARLELAIDATEHVRELVLGTFEVLMTRTAQRTNDIVRRLTILSSVLLPAGVIAGIMGMNFPLGFFDVSSNFVVVVAFMALLAVATLALAWRRGWL